MFYKRASKKEHICQYESFIQALHGVAFHSEEDAAIYPQSSASIVATASNHSNAGIEWLPYFISIAKI